MIAKFAYLTSPAPNVFVLNLQYEGCDEIFTAEISKAHLANILIDGTALALRDHGQARAKLNEVTAKETAA